MITILIVSTIIGVLFLASFILGFYFGNKIASNKEIKMKNPIESFKRRKEMKEKQEEEAFNDLVYETMMTNIENYDGTDIGQKDIPERE